MPDATSLRMFYQEFNLYILRVSRSLCCNTRKVIPNPSNFSPVDFVSKSSTFLFFKNIETSLLAQYAASNKP